MLLYDRKTCVLAQVVSYWKPSIQEIVLQKKGPLCLEINHSVESFSCIVCLILLFGYACGFTILNFPEWKPYYHIGKKVKIPGYTNES